MSSKLRLEVMSSVVEATSADKKIHRLNVATAMFGVERR